MRVLYYSDIHLAEKMDQTRLVSDWSSHCGGWPLDIGPDLRPYVGNIDLVVLAGDIGNLRTYHRFNEMINIPTKNMPVAADPRWKSAHDIGNGLEYARAVIDYLNVPVFYVPGNHEYYGVHIDDAKKKMKDLDIHNLHILDDDEFVFEKDGERLRVLGSTLWTDFRNNKAFMEHAQKEIRDYKRIKIHKKQFTTADTLRMHKKAKKWLDEKLREPFTGETLIVTHFPPLGPDHLANPRYQEPGIKKRIIDSIFLRHAHLVKETFGDDITKGNFPFDALAKCSEPKLREVYHTYQRLVWELPADGAYFHSALDLGEYILPDTYWIYGHNHWSDTRKIGSFVFTSRQSGYFGEETNFRGKNLVLDTKNVSENI